MTVQFRRNTQDINAHFEDHFRPYRPCFQRRTRSVENAAKRYLHGLFQCDRRNMEQMAEQVASSYYQRLHHMLSESNWSHISESLAFRTKGQIAQDLLLRLRREGLHYNHVVFDAGYGHLRWLLNDLDDEGETFLAEIHADQWIYLDNPHPIVPECQHRTTEGTTIDYISCVTD